MPLIARCSKFHRVSIENHNRPYMTTPFQTVVYLRNRPAPAVNCCLIIHCLEVSCKEIKSRARSESDEMLLFARCSKLHKISIENHNRPYMTTPFQTVVYLRNRPAPAVNCCLIIHCLEVSCKEIKSRARSESDEMLLFARCSKLHKISIENHNRPYMTTPFQTVVYLRNRPAPAVNCCLIIHCLEVSCKEIKSRARSESDEMLLFARCSKLHKISIENHNRPYMTTPFQTVVYLRNRPAPAVNCCLIIHCLEVSCKEIKSRARSESDEMLLFARCSKLHKISIENHNRPYMTTPFQTVVYLRNRPAPAVNCCLIIHCLEVSCKEIKSRARSESDEMLLFARCSKLHKISIENHNRPYMTTPFQTVVYLRNRPAPAVNCCLIIHCLEVSCKEIKSRARSESDEMLLFARCSKLHKISIENHNRPYMTTPFQTVVYLRNRPAPAVNCCLIIHCLEVSCKEIKSRARSESDEMLLFARCSKLHKISIENHNRPYMTTPFQTVVYLRNRPAPAVNCCLIIHCLEVSCKEIKSRARSESDEMLLFARCSKLHKISIENHNRPYMTTPFQTVVYLRNRPAPAVNCCLIIHCLEVSCKEIKSRACSESDEMLLFARCSKLHKISIENHNRPYMTTPFQTVVYLRNRPAPAVNCCLIIHCLEVSCKEIKSRARSESDEMLLFARCSKLHKISIENHNRPYMTTPFQTVVYLRNRPAPAVNCCLIIHCLEVSCKEIKSRARSESDEMLLFARCSKLHKISIENHNRPYMTTPFQTVVYLRNRPAPAVNCCLIIHCLEVSCKEIKSRARSESDEMLLFARCSKLHKISIENHNRPYMTTPFQTVVYLRNRPAPAVNCCLIIHCLEVSCKEIKSRARSESDEMLLFARCSKLHKISIENHNRPYMTTPFQTVVYLRNRPAPAVNCCLIIHCLEVSCKEIKSRARSESDEMLLFARCSKLHKISIENHNRPYMTTPFQTVVYLRNRPAPAVNCCLIIHCLEVSCKEIKSRARSESDEMLLFARCSKLHKISIENHNRPYMTTPFQTVVYLRNRPAPAVNCCLIIHCLEVSCKEIKSRARSESDEMLLFARCSKLHKISIENHNRPYMTTPFQTVVYLRNRPAPAVNCCFIIHCLEVSCKEIKSRARSESDEMPLIARCSKLHKISIENHNRPYMTTPFQTVVYLRNRPPPAVNCCLIIHCLEISCKEIKSRARSESDEMLLFARCSKLHKISIENHNRPYMTTPFQTVVYLRNKPAPAVNCCLIIHCLEVSCKEIKSRARSESDEMLLFARCSKLHKISIENHNRPYMTTPFQTVVYLRNKPAPAVNCCLIIHCLEVRCKEDQITSA